MTPAMTLPTNPTSRSTTATLPYISHADLGGQDGHGAVQPEAEGELWHAPWEPRHWP